MNSQTSSLKLSLFALAMGGFSIGLTEFVMMGILPDVAKALNISIPKAGDLISVYAAGVVVGAPILAGGTAKYSPKSVVKWLMVAFFFFHLLSTFSPNFEVLFISRFLSGLPHGAFFGVAAVIASRLAKEGKKASAIATVFFGLTIANVIGVPLGTYLGHHFSWRYSFFLVVISSAITALLIWKFVPKLEGTKETNFKQDLKVLKKPELLLVVAITSIGTGGFFAWLSYIAPMLIEVTKVSPDKIPTVMILVGIGMSCGNILGGKISDAYSPKYSILILLSLIVTLLIINHFIAQYMIPSLILSFLMGTFALALASPIQMLLINLSKEAEVLGSSLGQSSFNIGNALGAFLGGIPLTLGHSQTSPALVGACLALTGVSLTCIFIWYQQNLKTIAQ